jgi:segregation and condensation protein B
MSDDTYHLRVVEALIFASPTPVSEREIAARLPEGVAPKPLLAELTRAYAGRGVRLMAVAGGWAFRTAPDVAPALKLEQKVVRRMSRAAIETLGIIAYHQPVTRAEIEAVRGVALSQGSLDALLEAGWVKPGRRRETPGRPLTWLTTPAFLDHFGLARIEDLPGLEELKASGLLDARPAVQAFHAAEAEGRAQEPASDPLEDAVLPLDPAEAAEPPAIAAEPPAAEPASPDTPRPGLPAAE